MIKRTLIIIMALCFFLFLGTGIADAAMRYIPENLDYYGIWERDFAYTTPTKTEWDSGKFVDPEADFSEDCEDWVYNYAYDNWGYW